MGAIALTLLLASACALDNGLALTPPLGWLSWMRYRCTTWCNDTTSDDCFNEGLIRRIADEMVAGGYKEAGYEYVALDDCWQAPARVDGHVVADPLRFPSGIKALADYVHAKGLKLGLYTAQGANTCGMERKYPGSGLGLGCDGAEIDKGCPVAKRDIEDFASWEIDHLKVDGCAGMDFDRMNESYALVGRFLRATGRPVVYHPSNLAGHFPRQFHELVAIANQWRFANDIQDNWVSLWCIIEEIGAGQPACTPGPLPAGCLHPDSRMAFMNCSGYCAESRRFHEAQRPGAWHDPDMLITGNTPCSNASAAHGMRCGTFTLAEERTQLAIWAMASAPLFMSNDLPNVPAPSKALLLHKGMLAIDQDALGRMPFRFANDATRQTSAWRKELANGDVAIALVNLGDAPAVLSFRLEDAGFAPDTHVSVHDVWADRSLGTRSGSFASDTPVGMHDTLLLRLSFAPSYGASRVEL